MPSTCGIIWQVEKIEDRLAKQSALAVLQNLKHRI